jgi:hypothetical protein
MTMHRWFIRLAFVPLLAGSGCATHPERPGTTTRDGSYDSEMPSTPTTPELTQISESVRMVNVVASYRTNVFPLQAHIRVQDIRTGPALQFSERVITMNRRASGSSLVILVEDRQMVILSCAHVIYAPDTILTFYPKPDHSPGDFVRTMSIKQDQEIYVRGIPGGRRMSILAKDDSLDLVLLGKRFDEERPMALLAVPYPAGRAQELGWGTFVYVFGYPAGFRMLTRAIVSSPNRDPSGSFLLDAAAKPGYSGGAVFALRDGVPNFEFVGLVRSSKGPVEYTVTPVHEGEAFEGDPTVPFQGDLYVERRTDLDHGVSEAIPVETITRFLRERRGDLRAAGYDIVWGEPEH